MGIKTQEFIQYSPRISPAGYQEPIITGRLINPVNEPSFSRGSTSHFELLRSSEF
jgi:hypothetical protein